MRRFSQQHPWTNFVQHRRGVIVRKQNQVDGWFFGLAWGVSRGHGKFKERTLLRIERGSGVVLLAVAIVHGFMLVSHLARDGS
jgi:hypothetical protein